MTGLLNRHLPLTTSSAALGIVENEKEHLNTTDLHTYATALYSNSGHMNMNKLCANQMQNKTPASFFFWGGGGGELDLSVLPWFLNSLFIRLGHAGIVHHSI